MTLGILSVGVGDIKLSFDPANPAERIRAARIVTDMIRRGYALLVQTGADADGRPLYARALGFDEERCEYIVADFDPMQALETSPHQTTAISESQHAETKEPVPADAPTSAEAPRRGRRRKRLDAASTSGIAVARTAGG